MKLVIVATTNPAGTPTISIRLPLKDVRASLFRMLKDNVLCSMATVTPDHQAYVNTAYFSYSNDLELYFLSHPASRHCQNLETNSSMAMTVFSSSQTWGGPDQGLQLFGVCELARGANDAKAMRSYKKRFPAYAHWQRDLNENSPGKSYRLYRFLANRVKVFDEQAWAESLFVLMTINR
jgi:uncharacterized protein YhbP (UPF0306 family)